MAQALKTNMLPRPASLSPPDDPSPVGAPRSKLRPWAGARQLRLAPRRFAKQGLFWEMASLLSLRIAACCLTTERFPTESPKPVRDRLASLKCERRLARGQPPPFIALRLSNCGAECHQATVVAIGVGTSLFHIAFAPVACMIR